MKQVDTIIYDNFVKLKMKFLRPLLWLLTKLRIHPHAITSISILVGIYLVFGLTQRNEIIVAWAIIIHGIADGLDGALARYQNKANDKGKFFDVVAGNIFISLLIVSLINIGKFDLLGGIVAATLFIYLNLTLEILTIIFNSKIHKSKDWLFYSKAGPITHTPKAILMTYLLVHYLIAPISGLQEIVLISVIYFTALNLIYLYKVLAKS